MEGFHQKVQEVMLENGLMQRDQQNLPAKNNCSIANILLYVLFFLFYFLRTSTSPIRQQFCYVSFVQFAEIAFLNVSYAKTIILLSKRAKAYINRLNLVETFLSKIIVIGRKVQIGQEKKCNPTWIFFFNFSSGIFQNYRPIFHC